MTTINGIHIPCYGTLAEIHAALIKDLNWTGQTVVINGFGFTVVDQGFQSNQSMRVYAADGIGMVLHTGTAVIYNYNDDNEDLPPYYEILTSGKTSHISKRCCMCGTQLNQGEIIRSVCDSCHAEECGH